MGLLRAFVRQMPRVQAQEMLLAAQATALGTGSMKPHEHQSSIAQLKRMAAGATEQRPQKADPSALAALGIGVQHVQRTNDGD